MEEIFQTGLHEFISGFIADNNLLTERLRSQVAAPLPLKKQLWKQIVRHKIRLQAASATCRPTVR